jgi:hypothetical protein
LDTHIEVHAAVQHEPRPARADAGNANRHGLPGAAALAPNETVGGALVAVPATTPANASSTTSLIGLMKPLHLGTSWFRPTGPLESGALHVL